MADVAFVNLNTLDGLRNLITFVEDLVADGLTVTIGGDLNITITTSAPETTTVDTRIETARDG